MAESRTQPVDLRVLKKIRTGAQEEETERFHPFHEMFYVAEGSCAVFIGQRVYRLKKGDFAVIPAGTVHRTDYLSAGQNTKIVLSFSRRIAREIDQFLGENLTALSLKPGRIRTPVQRQDAVSLVLNRMLYEYENQPFHAHSFCKACLTELLISLIRYRAGEEENDGVVSPGDERIQAVAEYISAHLQEDLTLPRLAETFALSPSHLSRTFHAATGIPLREYLVNLRVQKAMELLLKTEKTVTEISDLCGFHDPNYFGDAFRRATGLSPRDYRKQA